SASNGFNALDRVFTCSGLNPSRLSVLAASLAAGDRCGVWCAAWVDIKPPCGTRNLGCFECPGEGRPRLLRIHRMLRHQPKFRCVRPPTVNIVKFAPKR